MEEYRITFYTRSNGRQPVREFINNLEPKVRSKVRKYVKFLQTSKGYLEEPYSKHLIGKIRELRVTSGHTRTRIFYFTFINKNITLLSAFIKNTDKTPLQEINRALVYLNDVLSNPHKYV